MSENQESQTEAVAEVQEAESGTRVNEVDENPDVEFDSLFDEEVSNSELEGDEEPAEETEAATSEPKGDDEKPAEVKEEKSAKEAEKEAETADETKKEETEEVDYSQPPPTGYVPIPALHEARREKDDLKGQLDLANQSIQTLQTQIAKPKGEPDQEELKDFKILSDKEFQELVEDDVEEALIYKNKLDNYKETQTERKRLEQVAEYQNQQVEAVINKSVDRISSEVPGIYEKDSTIGSELFDFAVENGFNDKFISLLTSPTTRISPVDNEGKVSPQSYPLADGAASLVTMLHKLYKASKNSDSDNLRSEIEAEVRKDEREKVTQELMDKFKNETTGTTFKSIADGPGGSNDEPGGKQFYSEGDFTNMSAEEERRVLGG
jgi:hypothetical protein